MGKNIKRGHMATDTGTPHLSALFQPCPICEYTTDMSGLYGIAYCMNPYCGQEWTLQGDPLEGKRIDINDIIGDYARALFK
uniref:Restriction alleviation protein n=1 Tax=viral metagenome TaxID=1070528 RepID=A0A6M3JFX3_9ZZZZ